MFWTKVASRRTSLQKNKEVEKGSLSHAAVSETSTKPPACLPKSLDTGMSRNNPSVKAQKHFVGSVPISWAVPTRTRVGIFPEHLKQRKCPRFLLEAR